MTIDEITQNENWFAQNMGKGPAISSRIRLARNLENYSFPNWASEEEKLAILAQIETIAQEQSLPLNIVEMGSTSALEKEILFERHLISQELAGKEAGSGVLISPDEWLTVMVNEEDHIRIQSMQPGLNLTEAWKAADQMDDQLESKLTYAFSPKLGYLTSCPSNVGTGMRASVMLHLPGLVLLEEMEPVINGISKIGLAVRGMWGEGSESAGNMFQVSNQITMGRREDEIIAHLEQIVCELIEHENNARQRLMNNPIPILQDHVSRAAGILSNARMVTSSEALNLLSALRLGQSLGLVTEFSQREIDMLFIAIQPAHLQKVKHQDLSPDDRDVVRADLLRGFMKSCTSDQPTA